MLLTNRILVTRPIAIRSVNGPLHTTIRGQGPMGLTAVRGAFLTNGATLVLRNLAPGMAPGAQFVISGRCDTCL